MKKKTVEKENVQPQAYIEEKEEKELMVEKLQKKGFVVNWQGTTPMFVVKTKDDISLLEENMRPLGSFGYKY